MTIGLVAIPLPARSDPVPCFDRPLIAFVSQRDGNAEIYTIDGCDVVKQLTHTTDGFSLWPAWSPDGTRIAFSRYDPSTGVGASIYVVNADGTGMRQLTDGAGGDSQPAWSPDGRKIAFAAGRDGDYDIFVLDLDTGSVGKLTDNTVDDFDPTWSPDGTRIAFYGLTTTPTDRSRDIFVMNVDGTNLTDITNTIDCNEASPDWSPDGTLIAYNGCDGIDVVYANGVSPHNLFAGSSPSWSSDGGLAYTSTAGLVCLWPLGVCPTEGYEADWQPSGATPTAKNGKVAFVSDRDRNLEIYSMNGDGTGQTRLTNSPGDDLHPVWSADGKQIAFTSARNGSYDIFRMAADGTNPTALTTDPASDLQPTWAPDGSRIAFVSDRTGSLQLFSANPDGSGLVQLTATAGFNVDPDWSPDGRSIVFTSSRDGNEEIYAMLADGTNPQRLTNDPGRDYGPYWSPDASKIVFQSERDGNSEIYVMDLTGSSLTRLTNNSSIDSSPAWSPDGRKIVFHSDRDGDFEILTMNVDGTGQVALTSNLFLDKFPDWQRVVTNADVDPPVLTLPGNQTVDATSPAGAHVGYIVSATDAVDPLPVVTCSPSSGSTFPIGTTTVTCTATDSSGNSATGSFVVTVVGATEQLARLVQDVVAATALPQNVKAGLVAAAAHFDPNNPAQRRTVCNALRTFAQVVQMLAASGRIPAAQAAAWIADAGRIRTVLGC